MRGLGPTNLTDLAHRIRDTVRQWTGMPVSVGIAPTKTLAKAANRIAKRNPEMRGVFNLIDNPDTDEWLARIAVENGEAKGAFLDQYAR